MACFEVCPFYNPQRIRHIEAQRFMLMVISSTGK